MSEKEPAHKKDPKLIGVILWSNISLEIDRLVTYQWNLSFLAV